MKNRYLILALTALTACTNDLGLEHSNLLDDITMTAKDFVCDKESRTSLAISPSGAEFSWSVNDTVGVFPNKGHQVDFPMINGAGTKNASFNGGGWALKSSATYAAYYPYNFSNRSNKAIPVRYTGQTQNGNGSTAHLGKFDYMAAVATTPSQGLAHFDFQHLGALVELKLSSKLSSIDELTFTADNPVFTESGLIDLSSNKIVITQEEKSNTFRLYTHNMSNTADLHNLKVYFMMAPIDLTSTKISLKASNRQGAFEVFQIPSKNLIAGKAYSIAATNTEDINPSANPMILVARANMANNFTVTLPLSAVYGTDMSCTVDWGDGKIETFTQNIDRWGYTGGSVTHIYQVNTPTSYDIKITGKVPQLSSSGIKNHSITEVKQWGKTGLVSLSGAFAGNDCLVKLVPDTDGSFAEVTSFSNAFANCINLKTIPEGLFDYARRASLVHTFDGCNGLTSLPQNLFRHCSGVTSFAGTFANCDGLTSIPDYLFANCTDATDFTETFYDCDAFTEIPAHLFQNCINASQFDDTFRWCDKLTTLPSYLFQDCDKVTSFSCTFLGCNSLTTLPENLFAGCEGPIKFYSTFGHCPIHVIPGNLFTGCVNATDFNEIFSECRGLKTIPANLFADCINATSFSNAFYKCVSLETIPENLFSNCTKAENFYQTFSICTVLKAIPASAFSGCTKVKAFNDTFSYCKGLTSLPSGLFDSCTEVTSFHNTFQGCSSITSIPTDFMDKNRKVEDFYCTFSGCALTGESPYSLIDGVKYHLYERAKNKDYFVTPTNTTWCFGGCKQLIDYNNIPHSWL